MFAKVKTVKGVRTGPWVCLPQTPHGGRAFLGMTFPSFDVLAEMAGKAKRAKFIVKRGAPAFAYDTARLMRIIL